ncbi:MAG TPA: hypothetical protein VG347_16165, partial [Verrucomicrobiae bacterium]|nr:hypothetical protein [Verrucomicrobiae bacterium]
IKSGDSGRCGDNPHIGCKSRTAAGPVLPTQPPPIAGTCGWAARASVCRSKSENYETKPTSNHHDCLILPMWNDGFDDKKRTQEKPRKATKSQLKPLESQLKPTSKAEKPKRSHFGRNLL